ncbi:MAG: Trimethylamine corrinoid protein MtbC1 [Candidatus Methanohalarchaeum thermophilum]|uniref:Trimethylamine corrinoid protein MtbC1 n=1 Tax=Methanohalarchaeum thermophilum TaxID=1903181 RepID=A0A1Q6DT80_METT1|nr:MAG: Trimethylamine corrinoid protein MtbC1 [Candidatus Methanohalarchaeum thermophilum]
MSLIEEAKKAVLEYDEEKAKEISNKVVEDGTDPVKVIQEGYTKGIQIIGEKFDNEEIYLPQVMQAANTMQAGVEILKPHLEDNTSDEKQTTVALATVEGDIHEIGKNIVKTMLNVEGFNIIDLGKDVPLDEIVETVEKDDPDVVGTSALMTSTIGKQEELEEQLKEKDLREDVKTLVGGAPVTEDWAKEIGADAWAENAQSAPEVINEITEE